MSTELGTPGPLEALFADVRAGRVEEVRQAIAAEPDLVRAYDPHASCCRGTLLNLAASNGDRAMIDALLDLGADIDQKSDWWAGGFAPIHSVPMAHRPGLAEFLIERGATVDVHAAAGHGLIDRLAELLDDQPDRVNQPVGDGARPLHFAATREVAELLVERGALLEPIDVDHGSTPAQWAARERSDVTRYLLAQGAESDPFMLVAIDDATALGAQLELDFAVANAVLSPSVFSSPGSKAGHIYCYTLGPYSSTLLHIAAALDRREIVTLLVDAGAGLNTRGGYDDSTALHVAAWNGHADGVEHLVSLGAALEQASGPIHGTTPLGWAIVNGKADVVERLLKLGAEVLPRHRTDLRSAAAGE
ncbi:MAG: ankyrin repeat domain-containing protein, partial [Longimicrobiales bacterium]